MQQLKQVGTSVSNHVAITAERKGNIASLRRQLEECGGCAEQVEIAARLDYWTGIDRQVEHITRSVMESMGYGRHSDLRVLTDPHARARDAAKFEAAMQLTADINTYCGTVLKLQGDAFVACIREHNDPALEAMNRIVRPLCHKYVEEVMRVSRPAPPELRNPNSSEAVIEYKKQQRVYYEYNDRFLACAREFNPLDRVQYHAGKLKKDKEHLAQVRGDVASLLRRLCAYKAREHGSADDAAAEAERQRCIAATPAEPVATKIIADHTECRNKAFAELGFDVPITFPPPAFADLLTQCFEPRDPRIGWRAELATLTAKHGSLQQDARGTPAANAAAPSKAGPPRIARTRWAATSETAKAVGSGIWMQPPDLILFDDGTALSLKPVDNAAEGAPVRSYRISAFYAGNLRSRSYPFNQLCGGRARYISIAQTATGLVVQAYQQQDRVKNTMADTPCATLEYKPDDQQEPRRAG